MTATHALLEEAHAARCVVCIRDGRLNVSGNPPADLLARLRAAKPELLALLRGDICHRCGEPMAWPASCGVIYDDGTAEHHACRLLATGERVVAGVTGTSDDGELLRGGSR